MEMFDQGYDKVKIMSLEASEYMGIRVKLLGYWEYLAKNQTSSMFHTWEQRSAMTEFMNVMLNKHIWVFCSGFFRYMLAQKKRKYVSSVLSHFLYTK